MRRWLPRTALTARRSTRPKGNPATGRFGNMKRQATKTAARWRIGLTLAAVLLIWLALESDVRGAPRDDSRQEQTQEETAALIEELGHALGMTPEEVEALGLSPAEMESLLAGFTEETVVVGSRARPRSVTESAVPVDVLSATDLVRRGAGDLKDQLRTVIPSFNTNTQPIQGASTVVRPAMLRNLAPDHTLVLINGKRRHRSSVLEWHGGNGVAYGSQGSDISVIPAIALRQVEVLRDGAAAQYGSDAIAGVMNFQLKDTASGGSFELNTGMHGAGDGEAYQVAGNVGLPLGTAGFANLSLEFGNANQTDRTAPRSDAVALIAAGNTHVRSEHPQVWGNPDIDDELKLFGNFGYTLPAGVQLYGHTNYASKKVTQSFFFRNPNTRLGVFSVDGGRTLLIGDALAASGNGAANCPTVAVTDNVPDPVAVQQVFDDSNCFSFQEMFPGGFTPQMGGTANDGSLVGGVRGFTAGGFNWDVSGSIGMHQSELFIYDTVQRLARPRLAHRVRRRHEPAAGDQPPIRRFIRGNGHGPRRRRRGMARRAVPDPAG